MLAVVLLLEPLREAVGSVALLGGLAVLVAWVSVGLGLVVSALARTVDQASGIVPLILVPQLLFPGALVPVHRRPAAAEGVAQLTYARWAYASIGSAFDLDRRLEALSPRTGAAVLTCFVLCLLAVTFRWPRGSQAAEGCTHGRTGKRRRVPCQQDSEPPSSTLPASPDARVHATAL